MATTDEQVGNRLSEVGEALRRQPSVQADVMRRVTAEAGRPRTPGTFGRLGKYLALAACAVIALALWNSFGGGSGNSQAIW